MLGLAFAVLLAVGLVLVHRSPTLGASDTDYTAFFGDGGRTVLVTVGLFPGWVALAGLIVASRTGRSGVRTSPRSRP